MAGKAGRATETLKVVRLTVKRGFEVWHRRCQERLRGHKGRPGDDRVGIGDKRA